jgi:hypothetical protein
MTWSTRTAAITALRTRMQDDAAPQHYTDAELGIAFDQAQPILTTLTTTVPANRLIRLNDRLSSTAPFADAQRQIVTWGLTAADTK